MLLYKKYIYLSLFLNKYTSVVFVDCALAILINNMVRLNLKKGFLFKSLFKKDYLKKIILGKL